MSNPTFKVFQLGLRILHSRLPVVTQSGDCSAPIICLIWKRVAVWNPAAVAPGACPWRGAREWDPTEEQ